MPLYSILVLVDSCNFIDILPTFFRSYSLQSRLNFSEVDQVPGISGNLVIKSKLCFRSGFVALGQLQPTHKKEPSSFFVLV